MIFIWCYYLVLFYLRCMCLCYPTWSFNRYKGLLKLKYYKLESKKTSKHFFSQKCRSEDLRGGAFSILRPNTGKNSGGRRIYKKIIKNWTILVFEHFRVFVCSIFEWLLYKQANPYYFCVCLVKKWRPTGQLPLLKIVGGATCWSSNCLYKTSVNVMLSSV